MNNRFLILFLFASGIFMHANSQNNAELIIKITGVRNSSGFVSIALFKGQEGFPEESEKAYKLKIAEINDGQAIFIFYDLPLADYAFAILHDENKDGEMKKNIFGIPKEGFAFSLNYRPTIGAPDYEDTVFTLKQGKNSVKVEMIYYL